MTPQSLCPAIRRLVFFLLALCLPVLPARAQIAMVTYHNDDARTGLNPNETLLTPANVNAQSFGRLFSHSVDGEVFAQPLVVPGLNIAGGTHDVVFICTGHDSVYAFDANDANGGDAGPLWKVSFLNTGNGVTVSPVPYREIATCQDMVESGVADTPAVDLSTNTLYVVAETKEVSSGAFAGANGRRVSQGAPVTNYVHRLHALDLSTGAEKFGGPVTVAAVWNGVGGPITFQSQWQINRPGLVLSGGLLHTFWASHCDDGQYYGWVLAYNPSDLSLQSVFNMAPVTQRGGIWQAGAPPAIDTDGTFFMNTATGAFDAAFGGVDYGESVVHFQPGANPAIIDYFSPANEAELDATDNEMGSVGNMILPDEVGSAAHPHLVTCGDKEGEVFLMDRQSLGGFQQGPGGSDAVVQEFHPAPTNNFAIFTTPCYYNGMVYWSCVGGPIQAFSISNGQYNTTPLSSTPESYIYPGCVPSISSNGPDSYGILWAIQPGNPAVLRAYDANNLSTELYDSTFTPGDSLGVTNTKFTPPTVANGKVYVAATGGLSVFGLLAGSQATPTPAASAWRIHCGGSQYTDSLGQTWAADTGSNGGWTYQTANPVGGTSDPALYDDERAGNPFAYVFSNVPQGSYQVTLKFAEVFWSGPGQRVFNASINGTQVLSNFDIVADAGGANQADDKVFNNITPDGNGQITVQLGPASVDNAKLSAIQVLGMASAGKAKGLSSTAGTPTKTSTPTSTPTLTPTATPYAGKGPVLAVPNIARSAQSTITFQVPEPGATLQVVLYDLAGERVAAIQGPPGASSCSWDTAGLASGLYVAWVEVTDADGSVRRQLLKVAVVH